MPADLASDLAEKLLQLRQAVTHLDHPSVPQLLRLVDEVETGITTLAQNAENRIRTWLVELNARLADLSVSIQYLDFDLGATKRERDALQRRLNDEA